MKRGSNPETMRRWTERLRRFENSGLTVGEFCLREGVSSASFYSWKRKLRDADRGSSTRFDQPCSGPDPPSGSRRSTNRTKHAVRPAFRAVRLTPRAETGSCLTVRLPGGAELILSDDADLVERVIGQLLKHATRVPEDRSC